MTSQIGLQVTVFYVEFGLCVFIRTPSGHGILYDCGCSGTFSPVRYISKRFDLVPLNGHKLAMLIVSHPHNDHIEDIYRLVTELPPAIISRQNYVWNELKRPGMESFNLDLYSSWQGSYNQPAIMPDWGMKLETGPELLPDQAKLLRGDFVNNSSIPVFLEYQGWKLLLIGDLETDGWAELLKNDLFVERLRATDLLVASHHGHSSGFSIDAYTVMGKPLMNVIPVHHGDTNVDTRYSSSEYARGADIEGRRRYALSTRADGTIFISITDEHSATVGCESLVHNL